jgi:hypothetical protein
MNEIILAPCDVISKIKQNSSDMNEIILASCDAGYVQSCTGLYFENETLFSIAILLNRQKSLLANNGSGKKFCFDYSVWGFLHGLRKLDLLGDDQKKKKIPRNPYRKGTLLLALTKTSNTTYQHFSENKIPFFCVQSVFPH